MTSAARPRLAVLIDADNIEPSIAPALLKAVSEHGRATVRRAFADWTTPNLARWKAQIVPLAIQPRQQFRYVAGKNASDGALIIDAMDLLHRGEVDAFCLVSSDSDFTALAIRLRESGLAVHGYGAAHTPASFVAACDTFTRIEGLRPAPALSAAPAPQPLEGGLRERLLATIDRHAGPEGWAPLTSIGSGLRASEPDFTPTRHGHRKLTDLVAAEPAIEVRIAAGQAGVNDKVVHVRRRAPADAPDPPALS